MCQMDCVAQWRYSLRMKSTTIAAVRVDTDLPAEVELVLAEGENLSEMVDASVRASVECRSVQGEFVARGLRSRGDAKRTGDYVDANDVVGARQRKLDAVRARVCETRR